MLSRRQLFARAFAVMGAVASGIAFPKPRFTRKQPGGWFIRAIDKKVVWMEGPRHSSKTCYALKLQAKIDEQMREGFRRNLAAEERMFDS